MLLSENNLVIKNRKRYTWQYLEGSVSVVERKYSGGWELKKKIVFFFSLNPWGPMGLSLSSMADLFSETFNESRVKVKINKRTLESFIYKYVNFGHLYLKFTNFRSKLYACCASFFFY